MNTHKCVNVFVLLNALIFCLGGAAAQAGPGKKESPNRGGQADVHMSEKGVTNSNSQWSADPDRGWVRAQERHEMHDGKKNVDKNKEKLSKGKGNKGVKH